LKWISIKKAIVTLKSYIDVVHIYHMSNTIVL